MSVKAQTRAGKRRWQVRYRDESGRQRARSFELKREAETFERETLRRKARGELASHDAGRQTLAEFMREQWWPRRHARLEHATQLSYANSWDKHVLPRLGGHQLRALRAAMVEDFRADLEADGVGPRAIGQAMALLSNVLQRAVEWELLARNPAAHARKPPQRATRAARPPRLSQVEAMRSILCQQGHIGDATLISVLMTCASAWMESAMLDPNGGQRWVVYDEAWRLMSHPALLRRMDAHWRLARHYGIANMLIFHKLSDLDNVGDQGSAMRALASSLLANAETRVVYRQESDQLGTTAAALELTGTEQSLLPTLGTGQGLWRIKHRSFVVQHQLHPAEFDLFDTTARMNGAL